MANPLGDFAPAAVIYGKFTTVAPTTGAPSTLTSSAAVSVYKDNSVTQSTTGVTLTVDFDGVTGFNHYTVDTSADGTFYAAGSFFDVVITTGTVGGVSAVGYTVGSFTLNKTSPLRPTTASRTLNVSSSGGAGINWGDVENPTTTVSLTNTTISASAAPPTAAAIATAVWQDTTSGDFTVTASIGKSLYTGVAPGAANGMFIAGTNAATTITTAFTTVFTGNLTGNVNGSVAGNVSGSVIGNVNGSVAGNVSGSVIGNVNGSVGSLATQAQADVKAQAVAALATDTYAEPGQGTPASTNTLAAKIGYIMKAWLNKSTQTASEYDLYNSAGAVVDQKATVSDDGTTFTRGNVASGP